MAEVDVQLAAARRRIGLGHVLLHDVRGLRAGDEDRSHVADQRLDDVALLVVERVRRGDRFAFLPEGAIQAADDFRLAEQRDEALLQRAREPEVVIDVEELFAGKPVGIHSATALLMDRSGVSKLPYSSGQWIWRECCSIARSCGSVTTGCFCSWSWRRSRSRGKSRGRSG